MKKSVLLILVCSMLLCLVSCSCFGNKTQLERAGLSDFVEPTAEGQRTSDDIMEYKISREEYNAYVQTVYDYLLAKEYVYFGTRGEELSTFFGGCPTYRFVEASCLEDFYHEDIDAYIFVMSNELLENNNLKDEVCIKLSYNEENEYPARVYTIYKNVINFYEIETETTETTETQS